MEAVPALIPAGPRRGLTSDPRLSPPASLHLDHTWLLSTEALWGGGEAGVRVTSEQVSWGQDRNIPQSRGPAAGHTRLWMVGGDGS